MEIGQSILGEGLDATTDFSQVAIDDGVASNLTRKATLPTDPLAVNVVVALVPGAITLDARQGLKDDWSCCHQ